MSLNLHLNDASVRVTQIQALCSSLLDALDGDDCLLKEEKIQLLIQLIDQHAELAADEIEKAIKAPSADDEQPAPVAADKPAKKTKAVR